MDPILLFLERDILPDEKLEVKKIRRKAPWFWMSEDKKLYKRSFSGPLLEELYEGIYGSYTGGRSLSHWAITQGY